MKFKSNFVHWIGIFLLFASNIVYGWKSYEMQNARICGSGELGAGIANVTQFHGMHIWNQINIIIVDNKSLPSESIFRRNQKKYEINFYQTAKNKKRFLS